MTRTDLQHFLSRHFNLDEVRGLCFALNIEHENFGDKLGLSEFIRELISFCERTDKTNSLIAECRRQRPAFATAGLGAIYAGVPSLEKKIIGREALVDELAGQLVREQARALSAEGMGGVGKTTLAQVLAHDQRIRDYFVDGVLWAGLGQTADGMAALAHWAEALGGDVSHLLEPADRAREVQQRIGPRKMLLVIDDAWSLETAQHLKCGGPNCCHLLTTRDAYIAKQFAQGVALGSVGGVSKVPPLDDPAAFALLRTLAPEACAADPAAAHDLAQRAGGLPLALEVLGGYLAIPEHTEFGELRAQAFSILRDPRVRLQLATQRLGATATLSLQAVLELSLHDLPTAAQQAWQALGAFAHKPATFSLAAAKAVCACDAATLATFVRRNVLEKVDDSTLALHQTLAEVARVADDGRRGAEAETIDDLADATTRHRQFYLDLANKDRNDWRTIGAAYAQIQFAWENAPKDESALELIRVTQIYQRLQNLWRDQIDWIEQGIKICKRSGKHEIEALLLNEIGLAYKSLGQHNKALAYYEHALLIHKEFGDQTGLATTLNNIGSVFNQTEQYDKALAYLEHALSIREKVGDRAGLATTLNNIGRVYEELEQPDKAMAYYERALPIREEVNDWSGLAVTLGNVGCIYTGLGQHDEALNYFLRALPITEEVGDRIGLLTTLNNIGMAYEKLEQRHKALEYLERTLPILEDVGNRVRLAGVLSNIGLVYAGLGQRDKALAYYERALPIHEEVGNRDVESVTRANLGLLLEKEGRLPEAEAHLARAVQICEEIRSPNLEMIRGWLEEVRAALDR